MSDIITPVLLSGGAGTRLWPASTPSTPKPFLPLIGEPTFAATLQRVADPSIFTDPVIVAGLTQRFLIEAALAESGVAATLLLEPEAMSTTVAIAAAAELAVARDPDALLLILAADHTIHDVEGFRRSVVMARTAAKAGRIVVFGIEPTGPETGYGYIRPGDPIADARGAVTVAAFIEKPDEAGARALIAEGCLWNSGNLLTRAATVIAEVAHLAPRTATAAAEAFRAGRTSATAVELAREPYVTAEPVSFDRAVLEKTDNAAVVAASFDWADIGTWGSVWNESPRDDAGNVTTGEVMLVDSDGNLVRSDGPLVGVVGMSDTVVVAANHAVLVAPRHRSGEVQHLAAALGEIESKVLGGHARHYRPWGYYQSLDAGPTHQVKRIVVNPGARLSLQKHRHRAEHWTVVAGEAEVTIGDTVTIVGANQSAFIPLGAVHRAANPGDVPTIIIEVQCGDYLGEDDLIRIEDDYGR